MKRIVILLIVLLLVAACGPAGRTEETAEFPVPTLASETAQESAAETTAEEPEETAVLEPTDAPEPTTVTEPTDEQVEEVEVSSVPANEAVAAITPATTIEEAAIVREQDWTRGTDEPDVVIIEYGDFQ